MATLVRGRERHLERQALAVGALDPAPSEYVVVALDEQPREVPGARVLHLPVADGEPIPLAAARNAAIAAPDADLVVCLDADCVPEAGMLGPYARAARVTKGAALLAGPVGRLGPMPEEQDAPTRAELAAARTAAQGGPRPVPPPGAVVLEPRAELFWSLAFAVSPQAHAAVGGFDPGYAGYGAEDTDYGFAARERGVPFCWVGGAWAHHQHHPISSPPVEHLEAIVANARRFREKWGRWPMEGWLRAFAEQGLVVWDDARLEVALPAPG